jgi:K+-sensing histidine kinase KdpD
MHSESGRSDAPILAPEPLRAAISTEEALRGRERELDIQRDLDLLKGGTAALLCHDVRGALCVVAGFLDMASEDLAELLDEATLETLVGASRQMDRIMSLLQDLGNYSQMQPPGAPGATLTALGEVVAELQPALEAQFGPLGLAFDVGLDPEADATIVHADLVGLALRSLIGTFGRLDPGPAPVSLRGHRRGRSLLLELARPAQQPWTDLQERILQGFARGAVAKQPQTGGLALGNWIARRAVDLLHGDLRMHCDPEGQVRFVVELPIAAAAAVIAD